MLIPLLDLASVLILSDFQVNFLRSLSSLLSLPDVQSTSLFFIIYPVKFDEENT